MAFSLNYLLNPARERPLRRSLYLLVQQLLLRKLRALRLLLLRGLVSLQVALEHVCLLLLRHAGLGGRLETRGGLARSVINRIDASIVREAIWNLLGSRVAIARIALPINLCLGSLVQIVLTLSVLTASQGLLSQLTLQCRLISRTIMAAFRL